MNHVILHVGEAKESYFREAFAEYQKRMNAYGSLTSVAVRPAKTPGRALSAAEIEQALETEAREIEKLLDAPEYRKSYRIALCIEGEGFSSEGLAGLFEQIAAKGHSRIVYLIGSSWGLAPRVKALCDLKLSFSPMTFAHSLFRVMLAEQIYRAASLSAGAKYHK